MTNLYNVDINVTAGGSTNLFSGKRQCTCPGLRPSNVTFWAITYTLRILKLQAAYYIIIVTYAEAETYTTGSGI